MTTTAMILAAGRGSRMQHLTSKTPKPLLEFGNQSLLTYHLLKLRKYGITRVVINTAYQAEKIIKAVEANPIEGLTILFSRETVDQWGTGGGVINALPLLGQDPFLLVSADVVTDYSLDLTPLTPGDIARLVLIPNPPSHPIGDFSIQNDKLQATTDQNQSYTYANIGLYEPSFFASQPREKCQLGMMIHQHMQQGQSIGAVLFEGFWTNINKPKDLETLEEKYQQPTTLNQPASELTGL